jgi:hypothetical protein
MDDFSYICTHHVQRTEDYWCCIDEYRRGQDVFLLGHIRFYRFSPSALKSLLANWRVFRQCVTAPIFALGEVDDEKWARFVSLLGFRFLRRVDCINGESRRLFLHLVDGHASDIRQDL